MRNVQAKANYVVKQLVNRVLVAKQVTREEHLQLTSSLLSEQRVTDDDRHQISHILDEIRLGRLKVID
ncbi:hypothetical protein [Pantanalinema sp. GBBB05]|uniref:hypothetical protein n=1 Tax=Pantanalinema sp. GBBB05 TaxID=2604139 RepID=UPI001DAD4A57|nr:hypothetical protein [Pantanalinema sp. GBBB05]